jgi:uncharacterized membrane protein
MRLDFATLAAIAGMAGATYLCRAGGYWLFRQITPGPTTRAVLGYIPGALFVSFIVPALAAGGIEQWVGAVATLALVLTGKFSLAILGGTAVAWAIWSLQ